MQKHINNNQPDWGRIAEKFDLWLPHIAPVGDALLEALNVQPGDTVLDVASGTGEPALTLARRMGNTVKIIGTDAAEAMVNVAQKKATNEKLSHIQFQHMTAEKLAFPDGVFDKVLCRFGVMLFEDSLQGLKQMQRVLKPGGRVAIMSFHSGEDRRVKKAFQSGERDGTYSSVAPELIRPSFEEQRANPRSSSTKLRWAIKTH